MLMKKGKMAKHLETGKLAEDLAATFLESKGYEIIARNYRSGHAEIDLIVKKDIFLVFVEVKSLYNTRFAILRLTLPVKKQNW